MSSSVLASIASCYADAPNAKMTVLVMHGTRFARGPHCSEIVQLALQSCEQAAQDSDHRNGMSP